MKNRSYLSLGSNIGNRENNLSKAIKLISGDNLNQILKMSNIYETEPMYFSSKNNFYNMVILIETDLNPGDLLNSLKNIEKVIGRTSIHNKSREIDIDILTFNNEIINYKYLVIPHPKIKERKFVLEPWTELDNNYKLPNEKLSINYFLNKLDANIMCKKVKDSITQGTINV